MLDCFNFLFYFLRRVSKSAYAAVQDDENDFTFFKIFEAKKLKEKDSKLLF